MELPGVDPTADLTLGPLAEHGRMEVWMHPCCEQCCVRLVAHGWEMALWDQTDEQVVPPSHRCCWAGGSYKSLSMGQEGLDGVGMVLLLLHR